MIAGMLWSYLPCGTYQNNSCYNSTLENRWQFSNQGEQVKNRLQESSCLVDSHVITFLGMLLQPKKCCQCTFLDTWGSCISTFLKKCCVSTLKKKHCISTFQKICYISTQNIDAYQHLKKRCISTFLKCCIST